MSRKAGLPDFVKSKYEPHLVEEITTRTRTSVIRNIPIEKIEANMIQPRKDFGKLEELAESIKEKGILEPVLVRPRNGRFEIIAGERRCRASEIAGLKEIPCIVYDIADNEALEISIIENIQRKDLDIFEFAYSLKSLAELYGYTHQDIAQKIGKSRVTVTELLRLTDIPPDVVEKCIELNITSKTFLSELVKLESKEEMFEVLESYSVEPFSREIIKEKRKGKENEKELSANENDSQKEKPYKFNFATDDNNVKINFKIKNTGIGKEKLIEILEKLISDIKDNKIDGLSLT